MRTGLELLEEVATRLGQLREEVIFVGGTTLGFYVDAVAQSEVRATIDVDCVIQISSHLQQEILDRQLQDLGFVHDTRPGAPMCRWIVADIPVDVMPTEERLLGFSNRWYALGIPYIEVKLVGALDIRVLSLPYFVSSKLEAVFSRGLDDLRTSRDFEDIVFIVSNNNMLYAALKGSNADVLDHVRQSFKTLIQQEDIGEAVQAHLGPTAPSESAALVLEAFKRLSVLSD